MPDPQPAAANAASPLAPHPMDPARGESLSPAFAAILCWAIGRKPMTEPAVTGVVVTSGCVYASTTQDPFFNALLGSWEDLEANLRGWGAACEADAAVINGLVDSLRRASR